MTIIETATGLSLQLDCQRGEFQLQVAAELGASGVTAVFGRSGSGKSTLLRCIAGFEPCVGQIQFRNECWLDSNQKINVPAHKRGIGYMFQEPRLFAHLNVAGNLRFAQRRAPRVAQPIEFADVVDAFALAPLLERAPHELSGGEAQRVALGRTLLTQPVLLLLDEPLAALDDGHKAELLPFLDTLVEHFELPMIYVSHDVEEVARLASQLLVLANGRVEALGETARLLERQDISDAVGRFDTSSVVRAVVNAHDERYQLTELALAGQTLVVPRRHSLTPGEEVRLRVRARDVAIALDPPHGLSIRNALHGVIETLTSDLDSPYCDVLIVINEPASSGEGTRLSARITRAAADDLALAVGKDVFALVKTVSFTS